MYLTVVSNVSEIPFNYEAYSQFEGISEKFVQEFFNEFVSETVFNQRLTKQALALLNIFVQTLNLQDQVYATCVFKYRSKFGFQKWGKGLDNALNNFGKLTYLDIIVYNKANKNQILLRLVAESKKAAVKKPNK